MGFKHLIKHRHITRTRVNHPRKTEKLILCWPGRVVQYWGSKWVLKEKYAQHELCTNSTRALHELYRRHLGPGHDVVSWLLYIAHFKSWQAISTIKHDKLSLALLELKFIVNQTEIQTQSAGEILIRTREISLGLRKPFSNQLSASEGGRINWPVED